MGQKGYAWTALLMILMFFFLFLAVISIGRDMVKFRDKDIAEPVELIHIVGAIENVREWHSIFFEKPFHQYFIVRTNDNQLHYVTFFSDDSGIKAGKRIELYYNPQRTETLPLAFNRSKFKELRGTRWAKVINYTILDE